MQDNIMSSYQSTSSEDDDGGNDDGESVAMAKS